MSGRLENPFQRPDPCLKGKILTKEEKLFMLQLVNVDGYTVSDVARRYGLSRQLVQKWKARNDAGLDLYSAGRPRRLDSTSDDNLIDLLSGEKSIQVTQKQFIESVRKEAEATALRRNLSPCQALMPSKPTIWRWEKKNQVITDNNPEETTSARKFACADIRNAVSVLAAFRSTSNIPADYICNFDASTYCLGDLTAQKPKAKRIGKQKSGKSIKVDKEEGRAGLSLFYIKVYTFITAEGRAMGQVCNHFNFHYLLLA